MECFSYEGGCGVRECTNIEAFKRRAGMGYRQQLWFVSNKMLFKTVIPIRTKE